MELVESLNCLEGWIASGGLSAECVPIVFEYPPERKLIPFRISLRSRPLTSFIPPLISLLDPSGDHAEIFTAACLVLQEILTVSVLKDGRGSKVLTEPLLVWLSHTGRELAHHCFNCTLAIHLSSYPVRGSRLIVSLIDLSCSGRHRGNTRGSLQAPRRPRGALCRLLCSEHRNRRGQKLHCAHAWVLRHEGLLWSGRGGVGHRAALLVPIPGGAYGLSVRFLSLSQPSLSVDRRL